MNFWSMKTSPKTPTAQSSHVSEPPALTELKAGAAEPEGDGVHQRMPSTVRSPYPAMSRSPPRLVMRADSRTGTGVSL